MNEAQAVSSVAQKAIDLPINAWMAALPILFVVLVVAVIIFAYKLWDKSSTESAKREERLGEIINTRLHDQTRCLTDINTTLIGINTGLCEVKERVSDIEDIVGLKKGGVAG